MGVNIMNEELVQIITRIVQEKLSEKDVVKCSSCSVHDGKGKIPVGISARHVHLTREHLNILFGEGYELKKKKELMGGQFAAEECVTIVGGKLSAIEKVRVLGPLRGKTQVEISKTDAIKLGVDAPVRESGKIEGSAGIAIIGPRGSVTLIQGCIVASRHIHMSPGDAALYNVKDNDRVSIELKGERGGILDNVQIRIDKTYTLEMHIDTDEANALGIICGSLVELIK
jgi:putative phosphotransacetylase